MVGRLWYWLWRGVAGSARLLRRFGRLRSGDGYIRDGGHLPSIRMLRQECGRRLPPGIEGRLRGEVALELRFGPQRKLPDTLPLLSDPLLQVGTLDGDLRR